MSWVVISSDYWYFSIQAAMLIVHKFLLVAAWLIFLTTEKSCEERFYFPPSVDINILNSWQRWVIENILAVGKHFQSTAYCLENETIRELDPGVKHGWISFLPLKVVNCAHKCVNFVRNMTMTFCILCMWDDVITYNLIVL
jgi:hypothetical protein